MTKKEFSKFIGDLFKFHQHRAPRDKEQLALWYRKVKHIPAGKALDFVFDALCDHYDNMFCNIPREMRRWYSIYQRKNEKPVKIVFDSGKRVSAAAIQGTAKKLARKWSMPTPNRPDTEAQKREIEGL